MPATLERAAPAAPSDFLDDEPEETLVREEMWWGESYMPPMANNLHQDLAEELRDWLKLHWARAVRGMVKGERNLTTPEDEANWKKNYRIPDLNLIPKERKAIYRGKYICGAPLVCVEIRCLGDRSYDKLPFYAGLGVDEIWIIDRSSRFPEIFALTAGEYVEQEPAADGWLTSRATGVQLRQTTDGKLRVRKAGDDATATELPED